jgi:transcriptional regulator with XRE-family HTH domain
MLGDILKTIRKRKGWTQKKLAEAAGVAKGVVANYEENKSQPTYQFLRALVKNADVKPDELFDETPVFSDAELIGLGQRSGDHKSKRYKALKKAQAAA